MDFSRTESIQLPSKEVHKLWDSLTECQNAKFLLKNQDPVSDYLMHAAQQMNNTDLDLYERGKKMNR